MQKKATGIALAGVSGGEGGKDVKHSPQKDLYSFSLEM
jgi:hypothetical protein